MSYGTVLAFPTAILSFGSSLLPGEPHLAILLFLRVIVEPIRPNGLIEQPTIQPLVILMAVCLGQGLPIVPL